MCVVQCIWYAGNFLRRFETRGGHGLHGAQRQAVHDTHTGVYAGVFVHTYLHTYIYTLFTMQMNVTRVGYRTEIQHIEMPTGKPIVLETLSMTASPRYYYLLHRMMMIM